MDVLMKIAPSVWGRLGLLTVIVMAMFFMAYGVAAGIQKLSAKKNREKHLV